MGGPCRTIGSYSSIAENDHSYLEVMGHFRAASYLARPLHKSAITAGTPKKAALGLQHRLPCCVPDDMSIRSGVHSNRKFSQFAAAISVWRGSDPAAWLGSPSADPGASLAPPGRRRSVGQKIVEQAQDVIVSADKSAVHISVMLAAPTVGRRGERYVGPPCSHGLMTSMPVPSKSFVLRVARVAWRTAQTAAIWASAMLIGRPARSRAATSAP
jgi:hypothetical protein